MGSKNPVSERGSPGQGQEAALAPSRRLAHAHAWRRCTAGEQRRPSWQDPPADRGPQRSHRTLPPE